MTEIITAIHGTEFATHTAHLPTGETLVLACFGTRYARIHKEWHDGTQERTKALDEGAPDEMWAEFRSMVG